MASNPPPLPAQTLARVIRISSINGKGILIVAGGLALVSALLRDPSGAIVGCLVAGAGAMEAHGSTLLRSGHARGLDWLIRSELALLALILLYCAINLAFFDPALLEPRITPEMMDALKQVGWTKQQFLKFAGTMNTVLFTAVGITTLLYQGGLAFYYSRKRAAVALALAQEDTEEPADS